MIVSFGDRTTQKIWEGERVKSFSTEIQEITRRKLRMLNNSADIKDLITPPSNRLEKLRGGLKDFYSIQVNDQWRIIFHWENGNAYRVQLTINNEKVKKYSSWRSSLRGISNSP